MVIARLGWKNKSFTQKGSQMTVKEERLYRFRSSSSTPVLALEDVVVSLFEGFVPPPGREGIKVVGCDFLESGVITLAMRILSSLSSSRREGDKGEEGRGVLSVRELSGREIGGADPVGVAGAFHVETKLWETSDRSTDARF